MATAAKAMLQRTVYPVLLIAALAILWALLQSGARLAWAPYAAAAIAAPFVILAEHIIPYRPQWQPDGRDLVEDGLYMVVVQLMVPVGLAWIAVWLAQRALSHSPWVLAIWPVSWPLWAQLVLKIAIGDFFRYWLHRAAHVQGGLWRLHAVHHAPAKLYATNVFRFHPAEKALQFVCDSLPFIFAGIGPAVLGYYFVFYAMSGLFQHSNCDVRLGWLNYLVSGPEVHRWHHSRRLGESNHNFAHSFVVWDLLFGTYYRPRGTHVGDLGLPGGGYPRGFLPQLLAPFHGVPNVD
jgi:sterol desaturase/sphingolipid hydroxylase (fatty acid hydroxylase superfamily)